MRTDFGLPPRTRTRTLLASLFLAVMTLIALAELPDYPRTSPPYENSAELNAAVYALRLPGLLLAEIRYPPTPTTHLNTWAYSFLFELGNLLFYTGFWYAALWLVNVIRVLQELKVIAAFAVAGFVAALCLFSIWQFPYPNTAPARALLDDVCAVFWPGRRWIGTFSNWVPLYVYRRWAEAVLVNCVIYACVGLVVAVGTRMLVGTGIRIAPRLTERCVLAFRAQRLESRRSVAFLGFAALLASAGMGVYALVLACVTQSLPCQWNHACNYQVVLPWFRGGLWLADVVMVVSAFAVGKARWFLLGLGTTAWMLSFSAVVASFGV